MFGLSPISGRLTDRYGSVPVILAGLVVTAFASVLAAVAPPEGGVLLFVALFLLGYGWNLGYVAGSALLTQDLSLAERTRLQGLTDAPHLELGRRRQPRARGSSSRPPATRRSGCSGRPSSSSRRGSSSPAARGRSAALAPDLGAGRSRHPRGEDPGAGLDLVERHVLVGAVGDPHVARAEDDARRLRRR